MLVKGYIRIFSLALLGTLITFLLVFAIPSKIVSSEKHIIIEQNYR